MCLLASVTSTGRSLFYFEAMVVLSRCLCGIGTSEWSLRGTLVQALEGGEASVGIR